MASVVTAERYASGMTFDEYVAYVGTPENLAREGTGGAARRDFSAFFRAAFDKLHLTDAQLGAWKWLVEQPGQLGSQLFLDLDPVQVGGMDQLVGLLPNGGGDRRVGVTQAIYGNSRNSVQVASALGVIQVYSFAVTESHRQSGIGLHQGRHNSLTPINAKRQRELPRKNATISP